MKWYTFYINLNDELYINHRVRVPSDDPQKVAKEWVKHYQSNGFKNVEVTYE